MRKSTLPILIAMFLLFTTLAALAEELRDLREGVTGEQPTQTKWGVLPRFKLNPDTGAGTGIKIKGQNVFGTKLILDIANIYTMNNFQTYEFLLMEPRLKAKEGSWLYLMAFMEYDIIPDYHFFGIGNRTDNRTSDDHEGNFSNAMDESSYAYKNLQFHLTMGWHPGGNLYIALEPFIRKVWLDDTENADMPNGMIRYAGLPGNNGGSTPGVGLSIIQTTRDDQWRPTKGYRLEFRFEDVGDWTGADFNYSRYLLDYRYYKLLFGHYNVLALHLRGETLEGHNSEIPWWELSAIGGRDSLRGFWENRFHGKSGVLINLEYRYHILHFKRNWGKFHPDVQCDGNFFYDMGQVFKDEGEFNQSLAMKLNQTMGLGFRFLMPPNLMGRLDIGKAGEEDNWAFYFNFGTVF